MLDLLFNFKRAYELKMRLLTYAIAIILLSTGSHTVVSGEEECSRTCPFTITGHKEQCTSAADICACKGAVEAARGDLTLWKNHDCSNPMTGGIVYNCEKLRQEEMEKARREIDRRMALLDQCRRQVNRTSAGSPFGRNETARFSGRSYELRLADDREGNSFDATLNFVGSEAVWRYRTRHGSQNIQGSGTVDVSGSSISFNDGKGDWFLEFSPDYRRVKGTYRFRQDWPGKPRTRHYAVTGRIK